MLAVAIVAPALAVATVVLMGQGASTLSVPVCVKTNGQVRVLTGANAMCDSSEQRTDWVIGGEVTNITLGQGLIGDRQGGTVQLAVDPALLQRGRIFSGFNDGPVALPAGLPNTEIARLELPAGDFAVFAKLTVTNTFDNVDGADDRVLCRLAAGADFDDAELVLLEDVHALIEHPYNAAAGLNLQLVHHFSAPGAVMLTCFEQDAASDLSFRDLKITALEAAGISNVFIAPAR
jgi:hypothetical protein